MKPLLSRVKKGLNKKQLRPYIHERFPLMFVHSFCFALLNDLG